MTILTRPPTIHVCRDTTPGIHHTDTDQLAWWLPVIGPTATVLAQLFVRTTPRDGAVWQVETLARTVGLGGNSGSRPPMGILVIGGLHGGTAPQLPLAGDGRDQSLCSSCLRRAKAWLRR